MAPEHPRMFRPLRGRPTVDFFLETTGQDKSP